MNIKERNFVARQQKSAVNPRLKQLYNIICKNCLVEPENKAIATAVAKAERFLNISYGICNRHLLLTYRNQGLTDQQIIDILKKQNRTEESIRAVLAGQDYGPSVPDLDKHPEVKKAFLSGQFLPGQVQQYQKNLQYAKQQANVKENATNKPLITICQFCQEEVPAVKSAVINNQNNFAFSHTPCQRHFMKTIKDLVASGGLTSEDARALLSKPRKYNSVDLEKHPEMAIAYSKGLFTDELIRQARQNQQTENNLITERFKKLAGINL